MCLHIKESRTNYLGHHLITTNKNNFIDNVLYRRKIRKKQTNDLVIHRLNQECTNLGFI